MASATYRDTALERAFILAREGRCRHIEEIRMQLKKEGFSTEQIVGPALLRQIRALCINAQKKS